MASRSATLLFATASILPAACLFLAALKGGFWPLVALVSVTLLIIAMDRLSPALEPASHSARWLPGMVAMAHFLTLFAAIHALGRPGHLDTGQSVALLLATGLFAGQVSNACAHELIHRRDRASRFLGVAMYCSILNGQHVSAHLLVHHVHAGTERDPNSAPLGKSFYSYMADTWWREFTYGLAAENKRRNGGSLWRHPYLFYASGALFSMGLALLLGGVRGAVALLVVSLHAKALLLLSDYIQHYGLRRNIGADDKPEPMGAQHSWNAPQPWSAGLMLNAPRHSDHHMHPGRDFTELNFDPRLMPVLPRSIPVMGAVALIPPLWRKIMDPRARRWRHDLTQGEPTLSDFQPLSTQ